MADNLLREVDEALRADRMASFWQQQRGVIIGVIVALVLGTAANSVWQSMRESRGGEALVALTESQKLLSAGKSQEAAAGFATVAQKNSGELRDLALVWQSRALTHAGDNEQAATVLVAAASGKSLWSDIACLRLAGLDIKRATCLSEKQDSPLAGERAQWAAAAQWQQGDYAASTAGLEKLIADDTISLDTKMQLKQWLASIKASQAKAE